MTEFGCRIHPEALLDHFHFVSRAWVLLQLAKLEALLHNVLLREKFFHFLLTH